MSVGSWAGSILVKSMEDFFVDFFLLFLGLGLGWWENERRVEGMRMELGFLRVRGIVVVVVLWSGFVGGLREFDNRVERGRRAVRFLRWRARRMMDWAIERWRDERFCEGLEVQRSWVVGSHILRERERQREKEV